MASPGTIRIRVERLERTVADELLKREQSQQYIKNMLENLKSQVKDGFDSDVRTDMEMEDRLVRLIDDKDRRLKRIELAIATTLGGLLVIGWLINHAATNILQLLAK